MHRWPQNDLMHEEAPLPQIHQTLLPAGPNDIPLTFDVRISGYYPCSCNDALWNFSQMGFYGRKWTPICYDIGFTELKILKILKFVTPSWCHKGYILIMISWLFDHYDYCYQAVDLLVYYVYGSTMCSSFQKSWVTRHAHDCAAIVCLKAVISTAACKPHIDIYISDVFHDVAQKQGCTCTIPVISVMSAVEVNHLYTL